MRIHISALLAAALLCGPAWAAPAADHYQHLASPAFAKGGPKTFTARELIAQMDEAGIERALLFSSAYQHGSSVRAVDKEADKVKLENDWTGAQADNYPKRLRAFCSVNPLRDYALRELARCAADPRLRVGVKIDLGSSDVQLDSADHLMRLQQFFRVINDHKMALVIHLRASVPKQRRFGAAQARLFLEFLMPLVPDVQVQVAHMAGAGPGYDDQKAEAAMAYLANAVEARDARTRNLWFDVAALADPAITPANAAKLVKRIRQVGAERVLFGSDGMRSGQRPGEAWEAFRKLPLSEDEFAKIAGNVAPYLK